jgi:hypothetical protein
VDLRWNVCPYCGAGQSRAVEAPKEKVLEPAARWVAPAALRRRTLRQIPASASPELGAGAAGELPRVAGKLPSVAVASQAPVRLFDRRKTRESARLNGYRRPVAVNGLGASLTAATLVDRFGRKLDQAESAQLSDGHEPPSGNGHYDPAQNSTDDVTTEEPVRLPVTSDRAGD